MLRFLYCHSFLGSFWGFSLYCSFSQAVKERKMQYFPQMYLPPWYFLPFTALSIMLVCFALDAFISSHFKQPKVTLQSSTFLLLRWWVLMCCPACHKAPASPHCLRASQSWTVVDASTSFVAVIKDAIFSCNTEVMQLNVPCVLKY